MRYLHTSGQLATRGLSPRLRLYRGHYRTHTVRVIRPQLKAAVLKREEQQLNVALATNRATVDRNGAAMNVDATTWSFFHNNNKKTKLEVGRR